MGLLGTLGGGGGWNGSQPGLLSETACNWQARFRYAVVFLIKLPCSFMDMCACLVVEISLERGKI